MGTKEGNSALMPKPIEALSVSNGINASKDFATALFMGLTSGARGCFDQPLAHRQSPSKDSTVLLDLVPSTRSSLIAQSITGGVPRAVGAAAISGAAFFGGVFDILSGRINDVNVQPDDNPRNVQVEGCFSALKKNDRTRRDG